ncbi:unnamed protein product [Spirodela intermedia]|uniref:Uncharacterized protein n=1 Tax=Spirodela intermedia TaxID=51605 RepID=A0A7I8K9Z6_SPIIN|nr:unnamed protein product [Spirodela intermedia]
MRRKRARVSAHCPALHRRRRRAFHWTARQSLVADAGSSTAAAVLRRRSVSCRRRGPRRERYNPPNPSYTYIYIYIYIRISKHTQKNRFL